MELINIDQGRVVWPASSDEISPTGGIHVPTILDQLVRVFHFVSVPAPETWHQGLRLQHGKWSSTRGEYIVSITELALHTDGIVVDTASSTDDAKDIMNAVIDLLSDIGFRRPLSKPTLIFVSAVVVDFVRPITGIVKSPDDVLPLIKQRFPYEGQAQMIAVEFRLDPRALPESLRAQNPTAFRIEPRVSLGEHKPNRYFCIANLATEDHLALLTDFEKYL